MDWGGGAGQTLAALVEQQGQARAAAAAAIGQARARQIAANGQIWGRSLADLGRMVEEAPQRKLQAQEIAARTQELQAQADQRRLGIQDRQRAEQGRQALMQTLSDQSVYDPQTGEPDDGAIQVKLQQLGFPEQAENYAKAAKTRQDLSEQDHKASDARQKAQQATDDYIADVIKSSPNADAFHAAIATKVKTSGDATLAQAADKWSPIVDSWGDNYQQNAQQVYALSTQGRALSATTAKTAAEAAAKAPFEHITFGANQGVTTADRIANGQPPLVAPTPTPERNVPVHTVDAQGNPVTKYLPESQVSGQTFPAPKPAAAAAAAGAEKLTDDAVDYLATQYRILGASGIPTRIEGPERVRVVNKAAQQGKDLGQSPAAEVQKQAAFKADAASLTKMQGMATSAEAFETKANAQTDIIRDLSSKVNRTAYPLVNAALQSGRTNIEGDSNATQLANAIETFSEEYAKIMSGATGSAGASSDSVRTASKRLINAAMSKGTMNDVLGLMQREMGLTRKGYDATIEHITERMGGGNSNPQTTGTTPPPTVPGVPSYADYLKSRQGGK